MIYDISINLNQKTHLYPGDYGFKKQTILINNCSISNFSMSSHFGSHIDFPRHFIQEDKTSDNYSVEDFLFNAKVVEIIDNSKITFKEIENLTFSNINALIFKTKNSNIYKNKKFCGNYIYLTLKAADLLIKNNIKLVGIDYLSVDKFGDNNFPVHKKLLGSNILILEGINLKEVPEGLYTLFCFPLKLSNVEAAPTRAVLFT